ncbi:hypothetical protein SARC_06056 [Sphaeroforma arctica JP610]|uniref:Uncharacterized protein n=1 Tax=Sphaeroforma arctica JP610 TaxID=667725 RepID=A0A0L0G0B2_9EUKA|nr:hypothetical protein SARC_06056 [Sphaeroforma arctica JP610]KNC81633.1 hypothetical protein SARC_06056 [Sphaeroforma arctica JP610]|eukprot:XP_014155535.1 hypothetical protein SARC_06056 [Sphaeroforma arctica JP610]
MDTTNIPVPTPVTADSEDDSAEDDEDILDDVQPGTTKVPAKKSVGKKVTAKKMPGTKLPAKKTPVTKTTMKIASKKAPTKTSTGTCNSRASTLDYVINVLLSST